MNIENLNKTNLHSRSRGGRRIPSLRQLKSCLYIFIILNVLPFTISSDVQRLPITRHEDCSEMETYSDCRCSRPFHEVEILCPKPLSLSEKSKMTIHIVPVQERNLRMDCSQMKVEDYKILPDIVIGDIGTIQMRQCPLPGHAPISHIFDKLGIKGISALFIESYDLGTNLTRNHLSGLHNLKRLRLSLKDLVYLNDDLFNDLPNLIWLDFRSYNGLPANLFTPLKNLNFLELAYSNLTSLPPGIFKNQEKLSGLNLWGNQLRNLNKYTFEGLTNLADLDLSANGIETLEPDIFELLTNLSNIHLSSNRFLELPRGLFANTKNLTTFRLGNNRVPLRTLPAGLLSNLPILKEVRLICDLETIPEDVFANSSSIINISLNDNRITTLPALLFKDQSSLSKLDLSNNNLAALPDDIFLKTVNLKILKLSNNQLHEITERIFSQLNNLEELYMDNNFLTSISYSAFDTPRSLHILHLQNNNIGLGEPLALESNSPFHNLIELHVLNLRNNSIMYTFSDWKYVMTKLRSLDLSYNNITQIDYTDLQYLSEYEMNVNLSHNQIHYANFNHISFLTPRESTQRLKLDINNNPLNCDCLLPSFVQFLRGEIEQELSRNIKVSANNLYCDEPENLRGKHVRDLSMMELLCPLDHEDSDSLHCPEGCNCWVRSFDLVLLVNCSNGNRTEIPRLPSAMEWKLNSTELNMENNNLVKLPSANRIGYAEISKLMLAGNNIRKLDVTNLPLGLRFMDIRHNELPVLNQTVLDFFNSSKSFEVLLSENPWKCDCQAKPLLQFTQTSFKKILDLDQIQCVAPLNNRKLQALSITDICPADKSLEIAIAVVISLFGFLIGLLAAMYYKFQKEIKIWLYAHNMCLWFVTEEELLKDKKYDAFISYSHKDEKFVAETLVPQLEKGPYPFKLCVHYRDFLVGENIAESIMRSVDESARTIVVLSKHFIESEWARLEFRAAHQAALTEKLPKVIVIMYSDIGDRKNLDPELQAYLNMNTYLAWGDPWFWDKLRYAMPHSARNMKGLKTHHLNGSVDDKLELIKPSPVTPTLTTPPAEATKNPLIAHLNGSTPHTAIMIPNGKTGQAPPYFTNGKFHNSHINGAFIINTNAKQSDV